MEVVGLRGAVVPGEPVPEVVAELERLLDEARAGHARALAYCIVRRDGTVAHGWTTPGEGGGAAMSLEPHALGAAILTLGVRYGLGCAGLPTDG